MNEKNFSVSKGPYLRSSNSTSKIMTNLFIALVPIIIFAFYKNGIVPFQNGKGDLFTLFYPLIFIFVSTLSSFLFEAIYLYITDKEKRSNLFKHLFRSYSIFPGLFLALILPINTPISILILGNFVATIIGKMLFGGFGNNIFNPALVGRLFIIATYATVIGSHGGYLNPYEADVISTSTPLTNASMVSSIGTYETLVEPYGNLWNFFFGTIPGALGETSACLCLVGFIYLCFKKAIKWRIPVVYILTVFAMTYLIGSINDQGIWYPLFEVMSGGLMFGAIFMATDPVTSPTTIIGQLIYGLFLGILTIVFRYLTPLPEGVLTSILTMNMFVFLIDKVGAKARFDFNYALVLFVIAWLLILGIGTTVGNNFKKIPVDKDYQIIEKTIKDKVATYQVSQKSFGGNITAKIVIDDGKVKTFEVLSEHDSYFSKITDAKYLDTLIKRQDALEDVDTVSGATVSSTALKKMLENTLRDYANNKKEEVKLPEPPKQERFIKEETADGAIYTITEKSFSGDMTLKVTITSSIVTNVEVVSVKDSYFYRLEEANYLNNFNLTSDPDEVDTVSGATVSSTTVKKIIKMALDDYRGVLNE